jgi:hypothetical protein
MMPCVERTAHIPQKPTSGFLEQMKLPAFCLGISDGAVSGCHLHVAYLSLATIGRCVADTSFHFSEPINLAR